MYINTPLGPFRVPLHEAKRLAAMTDAEVLDAVDHHGRIDPFALHEALRRGIWRNTQRQGRTDREDTP